MVIARATLTGMERKKGWLLLVGYSSMPQASQGYGVLCIKPAFSMDNATDLGTDEKTREVYRHSSQIWHFHVPNEAAKAPLVAEPINMPAQTGLRSLSCRA
ncbi:hypothetical protein B0H13DRAFT_1865307 [Mycena leptocephala]|nr:hypothetical protein B0H13DRAFT_1865307 [Mycena leptocephala]